MSSRGAALRQLCLARFRGFYREPGAVFWTFGFPIAPAATDTDATVVTIRLDQNLAQATADLERRFIEHALTSSGNRVNEAAQLLGLSRKGLFLKRRRQGLLGK